MHEAIDGVVRQASADGEAAFRAAEARERSAEAEAKATTMVSEAIGAGNVQALNYFVANNYVKALEALAQSPNQKVLMMPLYAASVIGSIGGIAALAKEAFRPVAAVVAKTQAAAAPVAKVAAPK